MIDGQNKELSGYSCVICVYFISLLYLLFFSLSHHNFYSCPTFLYYDCLYMINYQLNTSNTGKYIHGYVKCTDRMIASKGPDIQIKG